MSRDAAKLAKALREINASRSQVIMAASLLSMNGLQNALDEIQEELTEAIGNLKNLQGRLSSVWFFLSCAWLVLRGRPCWPHGARIILQDGKTCMYCKAARDILIP